VAKYGAGASKKLAPLLKPNLVKLHLKYMLWREHPGHEHLPMVCQTPAPKLQDSDPANIPKYRPC